MQQNNPLHQIIPQILEEYGYYTQFSNNILKFYTAKRKIILTIYLSKDETTLISPYGTPDKTFHLSDPKVFEDLHQHIQYILKNESNNLETCPQKQTNH